MTNNRLQKVAVVTGSSRGIGKAIAMESAKEGYRIVLNAREEKELSEAASDIKKAVGYNEERMIYFRGDISPGTTCSSLMEHTMNMFGRVDVLVNNAGIGGAQKSLREHVKRVGLRYGCQP
jgi:NAD(P)-dependent dehydrogenase (short-subunit alcohol dehydrogenase family)